MTEQAGDASRRQPLTVTLHPAPANDVFTAVRFQTSRGGFVNAATGVGFGVAVCYGLTSHYRASLPPVSLVVGALFWGAFGYFVVVVVVTMVVVARNRGVALLLRDSGLTLLHSSNIARTHTWSDVRGAWWVDDLVVIAIRGEALFVSSLSDCSPSARRHIRQMLVKEALTV